MTSGYKSRRHLKGLGRRPMPENDKTSTEEGNFNLHCARYAQKKTRGKV